MTFSENIVFFFTFLIAIIVPITSLPCNPYRFSTNIKYAACEDLPVLESSLYWNYHPSSGVVDVAFNKANAKDSSWVAWAINPSSKGMTLVNHVWDEGLVSEDGTLKAHSFSRSNLQSYGTIDFISDNVWKKSYVGIIISLAVIAVILEVMTWI
ncbi:cytochrome b561 and DOMON domain-containing protein At5g47530-like [Phaseolus vulgaris]|uniref:cytochrome b561 and DOMON domain-containing protein At5g47530-like n=1 Tax=Phaseolus vulgaris TaxID=3885 RepID=UPI0035CAA1A6